MREAQPRWVAGIVAILVAIVLALRLAHQNKKKRQGEELLARMEAEFRLLAENSSDMVERIDVDGIRRYVSPAAKRVVGSRAGRTRGQQGVRHRSCR